MNETATVRPVGDTRPSLPRRCAAEGLGTALLVGAIVGSGIAASRLSPDQVGLELLENAFATAAALAAIILVLGPVSGAHLNPAVTLVDRWFGRCTNGEAAAYIGAQLAGGCLGAVVANAMFDLPLIETSSQVRSGTGIWLGEVVATLGLILVIFGLAHSDARRYVPFAVAGYVAAAYWFTSSTGFANPAVTVGRTLSDSFAGIAPVSAPGFIAAQLAGAALAVGVVAFLFGSLGRRPAHTEDTRD